MTDPSNADRAAPADLTIVYDGERPFCTRYIQFVRLREIAGHFQSGQARALSQIKPGGGALPVDSAWPQRHASPIETQAHRQGR